MAVTITVYDGANTIGGNKILEMCYAVPKVAGDEGSSGAGKYNPLISLAVHQPIDEDGPPRCPVL